MTPTPTMQAEARCPKPGVYRVPFSEYLRWEAVNWHTLEPGRRSAMAMKAGMRKPKEATDSLLKGGALDCLVFDGQQALNDAYVVRPQFEGHPNTKIHKAAREDWEGRNARLIQIDSDDMAEVWAMYYALQANPTAWSLLTSGKGKSQLSIVWKDEKTGLMCKGRIDRLAEVDASIIAPGTPGKVLCLIDLKSTRDPGVEWNQFRSESEKYGYHGQLAGYCEGCQALSPANILPIIVAVQNCDPFDVVVHRYDAPCSDDKTVIEHGRLLYRRLLNMYATGKKSEFWPGQCSIINPIGLSIYSQEKGGEL